MIVAEGGFRHGGKSCLGGGGVIGEQLITAALPVGSIAGCGAGGGLSRYGSKMTGMDMTEGGGEDFATFGALDGVIFSCSSTVRDMARRILYCGTASTIALVPVLVITDRPDSIPIVVKRATIGGGAAGTLAGLRSGTGCISSYCSLPSRMNLTLTSGWLSATCPTLSATKVPSLESFLRNFMRAGVL